MIVAKGFLKLSNLITLIKQKVYHFPETLSDKSAIPSLFNGAEVSFFFRHLTNFSIRSNLDDTGVFPAFPSRTNVKM